MISLLNVNVERMNVGASMYKIKQLKNVNAEIIIPADKSISHRAVIFSSLCKDATIIEPFTESDDVSATLDCMKKLGVKARVAGKSLTITGVGMYFKPVRKTTPLKLFSGNSGTTMRLLSGLLSCQKFPVIFEASTQLSKRPMARIIEPLKKMARTSKV
jgi:3-phosphoshikimate 1-carboxyvinyltransferase